MATGGADEAVSRVKRITDIAEEPLEYLIPISGFADTPLVSLDKAVESLTDILPHIQSYVYVAKQRCKNPTDDLSPDESASIMLYTMPMGHDDKCLYNVLNKTLRDKDRQEKLKPWHSYIRLFLNALLRLKPIEKTVYRGVKLDLSKKYTRGDVTVWWGFSSCTTTIEVLKTNMFLGEKYARTMFHVECQNLRDIRKHSYLPKEDEMLLLPATEFKVQGVLRQGDLHIIQLKEIPSKLPLLEPIKIIILANIALSTGNRIAVD